MSQVKDLIVEDERKYSAAIRVALAAGELSQCDLICEELTEQHSDDALDLAYKVGNAWITKGDPRVAPFKDTKQDRLKLSKILHDIRTDFPSRCRCKSLAYEN
jgi:hypothetical protein